MEILNFKSFNESNTFDDVEEGSEIVYSGTPYKVIEKDELTLKIEEVGNPKNKKDINKSQFTSGGGSILSYKDKMIDLVKKSKSKEQIDSRKTGQWM